MVLRGTLRAGAVAVLAPRPAAGPPLAFLQLLLGPSNAALSRSVLLGILDPADELVAGQGRDVLPGIECSAVGDQRLTQVRRQLMRHPTGHYLTAHRRMVVSRDQAGFTIRLWGRPSPQGAAGRHPLSGPTGIPTTSRAHPVCAERRRERAAIRRATCAKLEQALRSPGQTTYETYRKSRACRRFRYGANRDRTGDLLLAKYPLFVGERLQKVRICRLFLSRTPRRARHGCPWIISDYRRFGHFWRWHFWRYVPGRS